MDRFDASWALYRWRNSSEIRKDGIKSIENNSVKKQSTQLVHSEYPVKGLQNNDFSGVSKNGVLSEYSASTPSKNIYDDDGDEKIFRREFEDLFFTFRAFNAKYAGKKLEAFEAYKLWRTKNTFLSIREIKNAIKMYMLDGEVQKKNGFKSFFLNELYFPYIDKRLKYRSGDNWIDSIWNSVDEILYDANEPNKPIGKLSKERLNTLLESGNIVLNLDVA